MTGYGVANRYGDLRRVLMHRPGVELDIVTEETLREFNFDRPVDAARFRRDYDAMLESFRAHGVETCYSRKCWPTIRTPSTTWPDART